MRLQLRDQGRPRVLCEQEVMLPADDKQRDLVLAIDDGVAKDAAAIAVAAQQRSR